MSYLRLISFLTPFHFCAVLRRHISHRTVTLAALALSLAVPALADDSIVSRGNLQQLAQAALSNNPALAARHYSLQSASEDDNVALAALLPQVGIGVSKELQNDNKGNNNNNNNDDSTRDIYVSVAQPIFNLPLWEIYRSSKHRVRAAEHRFTGEQQSLQLSVIETWLDLQFADDLVRLTKARIDISEEQTERAQSFAEAGAGTTVDVLDAKARLAALRADLLQNQYNVQLLQDRMYMLSGQYAILAHLPEERVKQFPALAPLGDWLTRVANSSLSSAAAQEELEAAQSLVRAADKTIFPRVSFSLRSNTDGALSRHKENIVISAEQTLFSGGQVSAEARRTSSNSAAARQNMYAVQQQEELRVRELHGRAAVAQNRRQALAAAESAADAALLAIVAGYENGVRLASDVLDAEETLFDARLNLRRTHYDYLKDIAALHALAGTADKKLLNAINLLFIFKKENPDV